MQHNNNLYFSANLYSIICNFNIRKILNLLKEIESDKYIYKVEYDLWR